MYRGACTDKSWRSLKYLQQCTGGLLIPPPPKNTETPTLFSNKQTAKNTAIAKNKNIKKTTAQRDTFMDIYPYPAAGAWEWERTGQYTTNFILAPLRHPPS